MSHHSDFDRRRFLKAALVSGAGLAVSCALPRALAAPLGALGKASSRISLTVGEDRAEIAFQCLKPFARELAAAIGDKRVIIKPNNVSIDNPLAASAAENLEGILEFLKSIGKTNAAIAESAAAGPTLEGFHNFGYDKVAKKYGAKLVDLDDDETEILHAFDETDCRPHPLRAARTLLDPNNFIISAAKFKTHDRVLATLSLKNIVVGAPIKDKGFAWGKNNKGKTIDKPVTHGGGVRGINYNLYALAPRLHPHLAVIDGWQGMEGNGPNSGTPVEQRVCVAGLDWLAADRVALELMGIDFADVGYLNFCADAGLGVADLAKIEILGPAIQDHARKYKLSKNVEKQLAWKQKVAATPIY